MAMVHVVSCADPAAARRLSFIRDTTECTRLGPKWDTGEYVLYAAIDDICPVLEQRVQELAFLHCCCVLVRGRAGVEPHFSSLLLRPKFVGLVVDEYSETVTTLLLRAAL